MSGQSMIERLAQTLHHLTVQNGGVARGPADMREDARQVLLAMQEPSDAMVAAGGKQVGNEGYPITDQIAGWTWERMIAAALEYEA